MKKKVHFNVLIEKDEDGVFVASVPALKGCHTQAKTYKELIPRITEAIELYIESLKAHDEPIPNEESTLECMVSSQGHV